MAQILALLSLLKKLIARELSSFSSVGLNNFLFCMVFILSASRRAQDAFWSTLLFQLVLLAPLLVTFSIDTQHRLPEQRVATWPLTRAQLFVFSTVSFALNPLFLVLFFGFVFWMGFAIALFFVLVAFFTHLLVYACSRLPLRSEMSLSSILPRVPVKVGGIAQETWRELLETLDFWTALLLATIGTLYRAFGRAPEPEAFPIFSLMVAIAMSTIAQRMLSLDGGRALLRYRLLPLSGWKVLATQDMAFLTVVAVLVSPLNLRAGCTFCVTSLAIGRYPSLTQKVDQRRWRFVGGDLRFGIAQLLVGGAAGLGAVRVGAWISLIAVALYAGSVFWGELLWRRSIA